MSEFQAAFNRVFARIVRARIARSILTAGTYVLPLSLALGLALWWLRVADAVLYAAGLAAVALLAAFLLARTRQWTHQDAALFIDGRLKSREAVSTALDAEDSEPLLPLLLSTASEHLEVAEDTRLRPKIWQLSHAIGLVACLALPVLPLLGERAAEPTLYPAGTRPLRLSELEGFQPIKALEELPALDPESQARLRNIAELAREVEQNLKRGLEERQALSQVAKLRDALTAELGRLGNEKNRAGLAAAVNALKNGPTRRAARALGEGDLVQFDDEMRRLAEQAENEARETAKKALKAALEVAQERNADEVARAVERQLELFQRRHEAAQLMGELAQALTDKLEKNPGANTPGSDPNTSRQLAKSLEEALKKLTSQERQQLAERLKQGIESGTLNFQAAKPEQLRQMTERLQTEQGAAEFADQLKQLAQPSGDAKQQQALRRAERGLGQAQRQVAGGFALPTPGNGEKGSEDTKDRGPPSPGRGGGHEDHTGSTAPLDTKELRAKSQPFFDLSRPLTGASRGRAPAQRGETANARGAATLSAVGASELEAVERSRIPAEYREQVSRYFSP